MVIFGHSEFIPVFLGKIVRNNFEWPFLAILNLYQSVLEKLFEKIWNSHLWPFWIYGSLFGKDFLKKFGMAISGHSEFIQVFFGEIVRKKLEWWFLVILNLHQSFWERFLEKIWNDHFWSFRIYTSLFWRNCQKKFGMMIFGHSKFTPVILGKIFS